MWTNGLGFRHLIEDGLAILRGETIRPDRRAYVLGDLSDLVLQAKRGSDIIRSSSLFVSPADRSAYESFSLLDRYLNEAENERWNDVLERTQEALNELRKQNPRLGDDQRNAAMCLFERILSGLNREPKPGISAQPEDLRIGG